VRNLLSQAGKKVCVLLSGGLDSSVLAACLLRQGCEVHPLYVRSGFAWEKAELAWLKRLLKAMKAPGLRELSQVQAPMRAALKGHWSLTGRGVPGSKSPWDSVYLPGRNLVLLSQAGIFCASRGIPALALALLKGNPFPDAAPGFLRLMEQALIAALGSRIKILAPFQRLTKAQVRRLAPGFPARLAFSCLKPRGLRHCGRCSKCAERRLSL